MTSPVLCGYSANRFVYSRGRGERHTNALLNGAPLPSPERDCAVIPLDVFPSLIVDDISIVKTFAPDVPADVAGGSVRIQTRGLPASASSTRRHHRLGQRAQRPTFAGAGRRTTLYPIVVKPTRDDGFELSPTTPEVYFTRVTELSSPRVRALAQ